MRNIALTLAACAAFCAADMAAQQLSVAPGGLAGAISDIKFDQDGKLALSGALDIRDLLTLRDLDKKPGVLDISKAKIGEYTYAKPAYIGKSHFSGQALPPYIFFQAPYSEVILPEDIRVIDAGAFAGSSIRRIVIPEGVESIGDYAFYACSALEEISLPKSLKRIGKGAFAACHNIADIDLSETAVTEIPERCFAEASSLVFLRLPENIASIGSEAFAGTAINDIVLPSVRSLAPYALADMPMLESVTLNKDAVFNPGTLMNNARLTKVSGTPDNIPALFAANCYSIVPSDVYSSTSSLGEYAFSNATVSDLVLTPSLAYIGAGAFKGLSELTNVEARGLKSHIPDADATAFEGLDTSRILLMVDHEALDQWRAHPVWSLFDVQSDITVSVDRIEAADNGISIRVADGILAVTASEPISKGAVFSIDGMSLAQLPSGELSAEVDLSHIQEKFVIITVITENHKKTAKIAL